MTPPDQTLLVRVTHRFAASAERVYDAFLDPAMASKFMFATPTGQIVRCEIEARVGGGFTIVDRRDGEDVAHSGRYLVLERPRRIVFTMSVEKYSSDASQVTIEIAPLSNGCELTLTHAMDAKYAGVQGRTREGWTCILELASELLSADAPSCGEGIAQHASIPAQIGVMFEGLAETFELHRKMLKRDDPNAHVEDEVYRKLATSWREIATLVQKAAAYMAAQRELPQVAHDESAWGDDNLRAFEEFVRAQSRLLALLRVAAERDAQMLASIES